MHNLIPVCAEPTGEEPSDRGLILNQQNSHQSRQSDSSVTTKPLLINRTVDVMKGREGIHTGNRTDLGGWKRAMVAVGGLLAVIMLLGVVGLALNHSVSQVTSTALSYDVELEDRGDDLRVAVLDVRHYHRNLALAGPSFSTIGDFEQAYADLLRNIERLERLGVRDPLAPTPAEIRALAEAYYAEFRPAVDQYAADPAHFATASDQGLAHLVALGNAAREIDHLGEVLAAAAFTSIESAAASARIVFVTVIVGLLAAGAALAYAIVKFVHQTQVVSMRELEAAASIADAAQSKLDFLADVSHELRTPLTVLRGNADVSLKLHADCEHRPLLEEIAREARRMSRQVDDLLFLARSDTAPPTLARESIPAPLLVADLAARAESLCREQGVVLQQELAGDGVLAVDQARIEQAILVLVDNAARHGGSSGPIQLQTARRGAHLTIAVVDGGPGIPASDLHRVFERRFRGSTSRGEGLGLAIARAIVEAHGGSIAVESATGTGTRMTVMLPLSPSGRAGRRKAGHA